MKKLLILAFLLLGCFSMASYAAKPKAKHVVYIGLDGWGSYSMPKANMPTVKSLCNSMIGNVHCLVKGRVLWYSYGSKGTGCKELCVILGVCNGKEI